MKSVLRMVVALCIAVALSNAAGADEVNSADILEGPGELKVNLELHDVSVSQALQTLFEGTGLNYELKPGVTGKIVEIKFKDISFDNALSAIASAASLKYEVSQDGYVISPAEPRASSESAEVALDDQAEASTTTELAADDARAAEENAPPTLITQDDEYFWDDSPVYYGQPGISPYPGFGYYPYPYEMRYGNVSLISRYPPLLVGPVRRVFTPTNRYLLQPTGVPAEENLAAETE